MSRGTFWSILMTGGRGAAMMFAVKLNKKFKKNFSKKIVFALKTLSSRLSIKKSKKKFFWVKSALSFFPTTTNWLIVRFQE